jgi:hypothetical protein
MSFFKNIFSRRDPKKGSDDCNIKLKDSSLEIIEKIKSLGDEKIEDYKKMLKEFKPTNETQKLFQEFIKEGIAYNKLSKAQKIVNDYGNALMEATELRRKNVDEFNKNFDSTSLKSLQDKKDIYYYLQNKFDIRLLPYDKEIIKEAIELLLQDETDVNWIEQLKIGLLYLSDFIDFNQSCP